MVKKIFAIFFLVSATITSQEKILEFNTDYLDTPFIMQNSFTLVDESTNNFTVFLTKNSDITAYNFNDSLEIKGRLLSKQLPNKYKLPLGGTIEGSKYTLFYSNNLKSRFAGIVFDFNTRQSNYFELDIKLKNEVCLSQFTNSNKLHLLTASYLENHLYIYIFDNSGGFIKKTIDLSKDKFYGGAKHPTRLKDALALDITTRAFTEVKPIQRDIGYSLDSMISWYKLYVRDNKLYLTIDINKGFTQIITYDLQKDTSEFIKIEQSQFKKDAKSSSFLLDEKLFQYKVNSQEMNLRITDIQSKSVIKEHHITKNDSLYIAIGPIRQRGSRYENHREFETTSKFLRKVGSSNPAIHVNELDGRYLINIGSSKEISNALLYSIALANPFSVVATFGSVTLFVNPVAMAFYRASDTKAVYIYSILNENFELINGEEPGNIFYVIQDYIEREGIKRYTAADIFKYRGDYIFGRLDRKTRKYSFLKF